MPQDKDSFGYANTRMCKYADTKRRNRIGYEYQIVIFVNPITLNRYALKHLLHIILAGCLCGSLHAQVPMAIPDQQTTYGLLQFNRHVYDLEDNWVVFPKIEKTGKYQFGVIYLDMMAGLTFNLEGTFQLDAQGHAFRDTTDYLKNAMFKYRLGPNTKPVAAIPDNMLSDLKVKKTPDWLLLYHPANQDRSSVAAKVRIGRHLNSAGGAQKALEYLESAYQTDPNAAGLVFELTYSYNELKQYDKSILVLDAALKTEPNNIMFYREMGYSYSHKNDFDNAIKYYLKGLDLQGDNDTKAEMAANLASIYRAQNKPDDYKKWMQNAKSWASPTSQLGQQLKNVAF